MWKNILIEGGLHRRSHSISLTGIFSLEEHPMLTFVSYSIRDESFLCDILVKYSIVFIIIYAVLHHLVAQERIRITKINTVLSS